MIFELADKPIVLALAILTFVISISFHEFAHAFSAYLLGDPTAKNQGRLTLNPVKHLDPLGTLMILFAFFGWARPVPVNAMNFKDRKRGMMLTSLAGPLSNLLLAFVFAFPFLYVIGRGGYVPYSGFSSFVGDFTGIGLMLNISLAVFNMLPIPPLDGSKILSGILPSSQYFKLMEYEKHVLIIFVILMFTGILGRIIGPIVDMIQSGIINIVGPIVRLFL